MKSPFRHKKHRREWYENVYRPSKFTGVPLCVAHLYHCRVCGEPMGEEITPAGYQYLGSGRVQDW